MGIIIGLDECGLGSWAGPLVTAAVVFPDSYSIHGVRDSKKVTLYGDRYDLAQKVKKEALFWVIAGSTAKQIDKYGVKDCRFACLRVCALVCMGRYSKARVIVDGNQKIPKIENHEAIVRADDKIQAVSAASIIAKVHRDSLMIGLGMKFPHYEWHRNYGYGTRKHRQAIQRYGICSQHRKSYKPIKNFVG